MSKQKNEANKRNEHNIPRRDERARRDDDVVEQETVRPTLVAYDLKQAAATRRRVRGVGDAGDVGRRRGDDGARRRGRARRVAVDASAARRGGAAQDARKHALSDHAPRLRVPADVGEEGGERAAEGVRSARVAEERRDGVEQRRDGGGRDRHERGTRDILELAQRAPASLRFGQKRKEVEAERFERAPMHLERGARPPASSVLGHVRHMGAEAREGRALEAAARATAFVRSTSRVVVVRILVALLADEGARLRFRCVVDGFSRDLRSLRTLVRFDRARKLHPCAPVRSPCCR